MQVLDFIRISIVTAGLALLLPAASMAGPTATNLKCNGCVGKKDIGKGAVTNKAIRNGTIKASRLAPDAQPVGVAGSEATNTSSTGVGLNFVIRSVTVNAPGPGAIIAIGSLYVDYAGAGVDQVTCAVTNGMTTSGGANVVAESDDGTFDALTPVRAFAVAGAGDYTINLVCKSENGDGELISPSLVAFFVPQVYELANVPQL